MEEFLKENEKIDSLDYKGLKIIQNKKGFCFGMDSVLLANFAKKIKKKAKVVDLGTGTGIISILLCGKTELEKVYGIEIQEKVADMAKRSSKLNNLEERFEVINTNIRESKSIFQRGSIDAVVTNPPYKKAECGIKNENESKMVARHEIYATLEDFVNIASFLLKEQGDFYMVHRPERLADIMVEMRKQKIEPKEIQLVFSKQKEEPKLVLIKGKKGGNSFLKIKEPLYIYDQKGNYTQELLKMYGKE